MNPPDRLLTAAEVLAEFFPGERHSTKWLTRYVPCVRLSPRVVRFRRAAVLAWLASKEQAA